MTRVIKRVPLDFEWETGKEWTGYKNPHKAHECIKCNGDGWSEEFNKLKDEWYYGGVTLWKPNPFIEGSRYNANSWSNNITQDDVQALLDGGRLWSFTRVPLNEEHRIIVRKKIEDGENSWLPFDNGYVPTAKEVNEWNLKGFGHDSLNCSIIIEARLKKQGLSHVCGNCDGGGIKWQSERAKSDYENWVNYEPPTGEGHQLWSEKEYGVPLTPVFESKQLLNEFTENNL